MNRKGLDPGPLAEVTYEAAADRWTLVFVRLLRHTPETVWDALTDPAQLGEWSPFRASRDLGSPGDATLTMVDGQTTQDLPASVSQAQRPALLEYRWGDDLLRWELAAVGEGTRLTLRHTIADLGFVPKAAAGWHLCLVVAERLLDGDPIGPIRGEAAREYGWEEVHDAYAERLGLGGAGERAPAG
jgi:uncharacterized protein YndB with AHSA1/START domain